jgi:uncharacterized protein YgbK (DUF1537 family)
VSNAERGRPVRAKRMSESKQLKRQHADEPSALLLAYYGDDFTGSTDVMEALSLAGLRTVLFLKPPTPKQLAKFPGLRAFGIAGGSRTMSPEEMDRELPPALEALKASGARIVHYKVCSTFDSSPKIGSIGKAIEVGRRVFGERPTPLVVGAPVLGRYVVFGNLFARSGLDTEPFRLDRHPTMSRHPVTPMKEADLRLILAEQTQLPVELVDVLKLEGVRGSWSAVRGSRPAPIVLFDTLREAHLPVIGRAIERLADEGQLFVVGSSGIEYALTAHWQESGRSRRSARTADSPKPAKQLIAVSGSCSPVTDRQIEVAIQNGIPEVPLRSRHLMQVTHLGFVRTRIMLEVQDLLASSRGLILHTSRGPADTRMIKRKATREKLASNLGPALALILEELLVSTGVRRAVVCGGDTSMHVARALGIEALEYLGPMAPGSPLCKVHAPGRIADGCEIVFKGGQVGRDNFFLDVLNGGPQPH